MGITAEPIVFFGNERLATGVSTTAPTLRGLISAGYNVVAVVSHNESTASRTQRNLEIAEVAQDHGIPLLLPAKPSDIADQLRAFQPAAGLLVAYGKIIPQSIIDSFPHGILNLHPSLLPKHRGPIPLESVILEGAASTGVSLMQLAKEMDAGPVYAQAEVDLTGTEAKQVLADQLLEIGAAMIVDLLPEILNGSVVALPQDTSTASFDTVIAKADGVLDWHKTAVQLEREVRAYLGWPGSRTTIAGKDVTITKSHVIEGIGKVGSICIEAKQFGFYTAKDILVIDSLKPASKPEMSAQAFLAGYGKSS